MNRMSVRHSAEALVVLTVVFVLDVCIGCNIDENCLPLRAQLTDPQPTSRPTVVNPGDRSTRSIPITCSIDCRGMNLTGYRVIEDWTAIVTTPSGDINIYDNIRHHVSMRFLDDTGITSITFERNNETNPPVSGPLNSEICNGTSSNELNIIRANFTFGDCPNFKTIVLFCGLHRQRLSDLIEVYDFTSRVVVQLNYTECRGTTTSVRSTTTMTPSIRPSVPPTEPPLPPTVSPVIASLSTFLGIAVLIAAIAITVLAIISFVYYKSRSTRTTSPVRPFTYGR